MLRKLYFMVQPIPLLGKFSRFLNFLFRYHFIQWFRKKNVANEENARILKEKIDILKHQKNFPERNSDLKFPEAE